MLACKINFFFLIDNTDLLIFQLDELFGKSLTLSTLFNYISLQQIAIEIIIFRVTCGTSPIAQCADFRLSLTFFIKNEQCQLGSFFVFN